MMHTYSTIMSTVGLVSIAHHNQLARLCMPMLSLDIKHANIVFVKVSVAGASKAS